MDNIKPWQIILFVLAIGVLCFSVWRFGFSSDVPVVNGYLTVDINTGQLYDVRKGRAKGVPLPAKCPVTGDRSLYPVKKVSDLVYEIVPGYESYLTEQVRNNSLLDNGKLTISVKAGEPIRFKVLP